MNEPVNDYQNSPRPRQEGRACTLDNCDDDNFLFESSPSRQMEGGSGEDKDSIPSERNINPFGGLD